MERKGRGVVFLSLLISLTLCCNIYESWRGRGSVSTLVDLFNICNIHEVGGIQTRMPCSFDVFHPGAEQVVLVAFEVEVLSRQMLVRYAEVFLLMFAKVHSMAFLSMRTTSSALSLSSFLPILTQLDYSYSVELILFAVLSLSKRGKE